MEEGGIVHGHYFGVWLYQRMGRSVDPLLPFLTFISHSYFKHIPVSGHNLPLFLIPNGQQLPPPHLSLAQYLHPYLGFLIYHSKHYTIANIFMFL